MAVVQGINQSSWGSQTSTSSLGHSPLIELSNALNKLNYDANSFISNPDFISFLTKELSSRYIAHDSKKVENIEADKLKDKSFLNLRQNNQSYFDYALLQELLLSWNCYCTINIYPKLNSQEIQHNLVFDTCLGEKQIPDNVASFIKNLLDRGTDLDYIINLLMALQSGKNIDLSDIKTKQTPKKLCKINNNINQQANNRKHVHFSSKLHEESNFESEKPILPPKKSTFKNPFKPLMQIKYRPFSKSPFRPSSRPPPPPAPIPNNTEITTSSSSEVKNTSPCPINTEINNIVENTIEASNIDKSVGEKIETAETESSEDINFMDEEDVDKYPMSLKSTAKFVESIQAKVAKANNELTNNKNRDLNESLKEKIYAITKIQPMIINSIAVNESFDDLECIDSNNNSKSTLDNSLDSISESDEDDIQNNELTDIDNAGHIEKIDPIYDLDIIENTNTLQSTETLEIVKRPLPPVPPPRKHRKSLILLPSDSSPDPLPTISPTYARPNSLSLPARPVPPPRKHRSKHAHTLPKTKSSHQDILEKYSHATISETSKYFPCHNSTTNIQPLVESECKNMLSVQSPPIPPPRRRRPTAPNNPFKIQIDVSDQGYHKNKFSKKKSLKEQFIKTTEVIRNKTRSAMSRMYNACRTIF